MKTALLKDLQHYRGMRSDELEREIWSEGRVKHIDFIIEFANTLPDDTNWKAMIGSDGTVELYRKTERYYQDLSCSSEGQFTVFSKTGICESLIGYHDQQELTAYLSGFEDGLRVT